MLTPTKEAIDAAMTHGRESSYIKTRARDGIQYFRSWKDKITGSLCFLNRCEESDDLGNQGSLL